MAHFDLSGDEETVKPYNPIDYILARRDDLWMTYLIGSRAMYLLKRHGIKNDKDFFELWPTLNSLKWTNFGIGCYDRCVQAYSYKNEWIKHNGAF